MRSLLAEISADYSVRVSKASPTRSCIVRERLVHDRCNRGSEFAPTETTELSFLKNYHLACSCVCWRVELADRSPVCGTLVPRQNKASATTPENLKAPSTSSLKENFSLSLFHPQRFPSRALVDRAMDDVEVSVSATPIVLLRELKLSDSGKTEYRANALSADHLAHPARLSNSDRVKKPGNMVYGGRWVKSSGSFLGMEKSAPRHRFSVPFLPVDGISAVPHYFTDGVHCCAMSTTVEAFGIDWPVSPKKLLRNCGSGRIAPLSPTNT